MRATRRGGTWKAVRVRENCSLSKRKAMRTPQRVKNERTKSIRRMLRFGTRRPWSDSRADLKHEGRREGDDRPPHFGMLKKLSKPRNWPRQTRRMSCGKTIKGRKCLNSSLILAVGRKSISVVKKAKTEGQRDEVSHQYPEPIGEYGLKNDPKIWSQVARSAYCRFNSIFFGRQ